MQHKKWHFTYENLIIGDNVYFKLTESMISQNWWIRKLDDIKTGSDGYLREIIISYKGTSGTLLKTGLIGLSRD